MHNTFASAGFAAAAFAVGVSTQATSGSFDILSMNVAGLPPLFNGNDVPGDKATNARTIGTLFSQYNYDVINVQEDFNYHAYIYATDTHPYRTATTGGAGIGSGMNTLSNFPWVDFSRTKWKDCSNASGADCLTPKGFTFMRVKVSDGVWVDMYNLHSDAGTQDGDQVARRSNIQELADYINYWSAGNAVVVFGDTNSRYTRAADNIRVLSSQCGLWDAWAVLEHGNVVPTVESVCSNPSLINTCETVDKVFYRGGGVTGLDARDFNYESTKFLQADGNILSDHNPITVNFYWSTSPTRRQSNFHGGPHGDWFNDVTSLPAAPRARTIAFRGNSRVDQVSLTLTNGQTFTHGGTGGNAVSLTLASNEFWTSVYLCQAQYSSRTRIFYIRATTSTGRTLAVGATTSDCTTFTAPSGWQIVGYLGQAGTEIDQLAVLYAPQ